MRSNGVDSRCSTADSFFSYRTVPEPVALGLSCDSYQLQVSHEGKEIATLFCLRLIDFR